MSAPEVSVLMPCFNHGPFVEQAAESVFASADRAGVSMELLALDDGSADDSVARLEGLRDPRLQIRRQDNAGAHVAFNRLLEQARGELIFLLNSDDRYAPERIGELVETFARRPDALAVGSWVQVIDGEGQVLGLKKAWHTLPPWPRPRRGPALVDLDDPSLALLETNYLATTSNIAFRRAAIEDGLRFRDLRYCHDWDFFLGLCRRGPLALVEAPLVDYRVHGANTLDETRADGEARMRFEILWLLARHAGALCRQWGEGQGGDASEDLRRRLHNSLPTFSCDSLAGQLLAWRGDGPLAPASFEALLDRRHPFRRRAEALLKESP